MATDSSSFKGRGIASTPASPYDSQQLCLLHNEGIDAPLHEGSPRTQTHVARPKSILNRVKSPDIPMEYSMNPYQGCEHGCVYCYARRSHTYWGLSAGLDFETRIIIKKDAPQLLEKAFLRKNWQPNPIMLSGNTDCYQPLEQKWQLTRACLKVFLRYGNPVGIITKNALITRDIDLLSALAKRGLVRVFLSLTTFDEKLRRLMEPRTATLKRRLQTISELARAGIPTGAMIAPIIVGLNDHEIPALIKESAAHGALTVGYNLLRLDEELAPLFKDWLHKKYPDKASKIWQQISEVHQGNPIHPRSGERMRGTGTLAHMVAQLFTISRRKYFSNKSMPSYDYTQFSMPHKPKLFQTQHT